MEMDSGPETLTMPMAPPDAVAMAQIVDVFSFVFKFVTGLLLSKCLWCSCSLCLLSDFYGWQ